MSSQVIKPGTVIIHPDGKVEVKDFDVEFISPDMSGCEEAWFVGASWALSKIEQAFLSSGNDKRMLG